MDQPIRGSCMCGGIRFEITGPPLWLSWCHCTRCRKVGGMANVSIRAEHFRWTSGAELVRRYEPEPPYHLVRCFCSVCGSYLGEPETSDKGFPIAATALDDDPGVRAILHEFVSDKPAWYEILDDLPQYAREPVFPGKG
jgi:hypothetical protein